MALCPVLVAAPVLHNINLTTGWPRSGSKALSFPVGAALGDILPSIQMAGQVP